MSTARAAASTAGDDQHPPLQKTYYESQRVMLITEIAQSLEHVLVNINRLNRSMEELIQVGNEFAPVESLWSHFESVMGNQNQGHPPSSSSSSHQQQQEQRQEGGDTIAGGGGGGGLASEGRNGGRGKRSGEVEGDVSTVGVGEEVGEESMY